MNMNGLIAMGQNAVGQDSAIYHLMQLGCVHLLIAIGGVLVGWFLHLWRQSRYGKYIIVRTCWFEGWENAEGPVTLVDKVILSGSALSLAGTKAAAMLVKASKKLSGNGCLGSKVWSRDCGIKVLNRLRDRTSEMFAKGAMARAMRDKDVTKCEFMICAFNRDDEISLILVAKHDLELINSGREIIVDGANIGEVRVLANIYTNDKEYWTKTKIYE